MAKLKANGTQVARRPELDPAFGRAGEGLTMNLRAFITAGNATFTVTSKKTGARYTYRVRRVDNNPSRYFVSVLTGPDNTTDFTYAGMLRTDGDKWTVYQTRGSKVSGSAPSWNGFRWVVGMLILNRPISDQADVHHEGKCGRCGRALTVPESIESGFGPECINKVGG